MRAQHWLQLGIVGTNDMPNMGVKISQEFQLDMDVYYRLQQHINWYTIAVIHY